MPRRKRRLQSFFLTAKLLRIISSYIKRTISIKLNTTAEQNAALEDLQKEFNAACNQIVPLAAVNKCANRVALHHICYYAVREAHPTLGSQLVCHAVKAVADAYKTFFANNPKKRRNVKRPLPESVNNLL